MRSEFNPLSDPICDFSDSEAWPGFAESLYDRGRFTEILRQSVTSAVLYERHRMSLAALDAVETLLQPEFNRDQVAPALEILYQQLADLYHQADIPKRLRTRQFICASGLIMSPDHCITTIRDARRMHAFVRGIDQGLRILREKFEGPLHIVYPACGPFAPLLLPLLSFYQQSGSYSANDLKITLIDVQEGATQSLWQVIKALEVQEFIADVMCMDALEYRSDQVVHMVVIEAMQHGFSREGHFLLARHFAQLLDGQGLMIPEEISVRAVLNDPQEELVTQWQECNGQGESDQLKQRIRGKRKELGEILKMDVAFLRSVAPAAGRDQSLMVACGQVTVPVLTPSEGSPILMLITTVNTYGGEWLHDYDSGITHPLPDAQVCINFIPKDAQPGDLWVNSGDCLRFYYNFTGLPGFFAVRENLADSSAKVSRELAHDC